MHLKINGAAYWVHPLVDPSEADTKLRSSLLIESIGVK